MIYRSWFTGTIPAQWVPVSDWRVSDFSGHNVLGDNTVTFYAVGPAQAAQLARDIADFRAQLPPGVRTRQLWPRAAEEEQSSADAAALP